MMLRTLCKWRLGAWVAIAALLVQALLPGVIHSAQAAPGVPTEICTAVGIKTIAQTESGKWSPGSLSEHCALCTLADALALPSQQLVYNVDAYRDAAAPALVASQTTPAVPLSIFLRGPPFLA